MLDEADFAHFARLRSLRKALAEREGMPAYALFTNEQLAEMVTKLASSLADLQTIDGVGEAKTKKYGEAFLAELKQGLTEHARQAEPQHRVPSCPSAMRCWMASD